MVNATGVVYALERADLVQVYVGQTTRLRGRVREHRSRRHPLFEDGEPVVIELVRVAVGEDLNDAERLFACAYANQGWDVVSHNTANIGWTAQTNLGRSPTHPGTGRQGSVNVETGLWAQIKPLGDVAGGKAAMRKRHRCNDCGVVYSPASMGHHRKATGHTSTPL
jgi:hypothetical protein